MKVRESSYWERQETNWTTKTNPRYISKKTFAFIIPASLKWIYTDILDFAVHFHGSSCSAVRHSAKPSCLGIPWPDFLQKPHNLRFHGETFCRSNIISDSTRAYISNNEM